MSDEYSIGNRFLTGKINEAEYWRKMARLGLADEDWTEVLAEIDRDRSGVNRGNRREENDA